MKKIILLILSLIFIISQFSSDSSQLCALYLVSDDSGEEMPRHFRILKEVNVWKSPLNLQGLNRLRASGSGQFSEKNFAGMIRSLPTSSERLMIVDLRQESHGFMNGKPVSWSDGNYNYSNLHKSKVEIEMDENQRLRGAVQTKRMIIDPMKGATKLKVYTVKSERDFVEGNQIKYMRLPVTDHNRPTNEVIDQFIELVKNRPSDQWLHFHCRAGKGRTTTFLILLDIMNNGQHVSLEDILSRQQLFGGADINATSRKDLEKQRAALGRLEFIQHFYQYCRQNPDFQKSWSDWIDL